MHTVYVELPGHTMPCSGFKSNNISEKFCKNYTNVANIMSGISCFLAPWLNRMYIFVQLSNRKQLPVWLGRCDDSLNVSSAFKETSSK